VTLKPLSNLASQWLSDSRSLNSIHNKFLFPFDHFTNPKDSTNPPDDIESLDFEDYGEEDTEALETPQKPDTTPNKPIQVQEAHPTKMAEEKLPTPGGEPPTKTLDRKNNANLTDIERKKLRDDMMGRFVGNH
jgi:hypothetical protein